jgi:hypothetical protein
MISEQTSLISFKATSKEHGILRRRLDKRAGEYRHRRDNTRHAHFSLAGLSSAGYERQYSGAFLDPSPKLQINLGVNEFGPFIFEVETTYLRKSQRRNDGAVVINIGESAKTANRSTCGRASIRLVGFDDCPIRLVGHAREASVNLAPEAFSALGDGKGDSPLLAQTEVFLANRFDERPSELVERASKVVQNLTEKQTMLRPQDGGIGDTDRKGRPWSRVGRPSRFGIRIGVNITPSGLRCRVESGQKLSVKNAQFLLGPSQLRFTVSEGIDGH